MRWNGFKGGANLALPRLLMHVASGIFGLALCALSLVAFPNQASAEITLAQRQVPIGTLFNDTCDVVSPGQLSWFEAYSKIKSLPWPGLGPNRAFGVQRNDGWFYLWDLDAAYAQTLCGITRSAYTKPICSVPLRNRSGQPVPGSSLVFLAMMDLDGTGRRDYLVGIQGSASNWTYVWRADGTNCSGTLPLVTDGPLKNAQGVIVPASAIRAAVTGDFDRDKKDELRVLQKGGSWNYIWKIDTRANAIALFRSGDLRNAQGTPINTDSLTFVDVADLDDYGSNAIQETVLVGIQGGWGMEWGLGENAIRDLPLCSDANVDCSRKALVFSLDQGFSNGLVRYGTSTPEMRAVYGRVLQSLKELQVKYDVYALVNPIIANKTDHLNLYNILDLITAQGISFYLEVYSSDNTTITAYQPSLNNVSNVKYGLGPVVSGGAAGTVSLQAIHNRYGRLFAGIRIFETGSLDFAESECIRTSSCSVAIPPDQIVPDYFNVAAAEPYVAFAKANQKSVLLGDLLWVAPWDDGRTWKPGDSISRFRNGVATLAQRYPGTIYTMYDTNESYGAAMRSGLHRITDWNRYLQFSGTKGIALSNQSWACDRKPGFHSANCPAEYIALWTGDALRNKSAAVVQFEPFWYLFKWPLGVMADAVQPLDLSAPQNADLGAPTPNLCLLAGSLAVTLSLCPH